MQTNQRARGENCQRSYAPLWADRLDLLKQVQWKRNEPNTAVEDKQEPANKRQERHRVNHNRNLPTTTPDRRRATRVTRSRKTTEYPLLGMACVPLSQECPLKTRMFQHLHTLQRGSRQGSLHMESRPFSSSGANAVSMWTSTPKQLTICEPLEVTDCTWAGRNSPGSGYVHIRPGNWDPGDSHERPHNVKDRDDDNQHDHFVTQRHRRRPPAAFLKTNQTRGRGTG